MGMVMPSVDTIVALENGELSPLESAVALQVMINSGAGWKMQGSYGRAMMSAIEAGDCMVGEEPRYDYWGNRIPARGELVDGSVGTRGYVVARRGEDWALALEKAGS